MTQSVPHSDVLRIGTVLEISADRKTVRVAVGDLESDWVDWASTRAGKTTVWIPPCVGEQMLIFSPDGDFEGAIPLGSLFCDAFPAPNEPDRMLIKFEDGAVLAYNPVTHSLEAILPAGGKVTLTADSGVTLNVAGGLTINGDVTLNGTLTSNQDVIASGKSLKTHKHSGVQAGGAQTGAPV